MSLDNTLPRLWCMRDPVLPAFRCVLLPALSSFASELIWLKHTLQENNPLQLEQSGDLALLMTTQALKFIEKYRDGGGKGSTVQKATPISEPMVRSQGGYAVTKCLSSLQFF